MLVSKLSRIFLEKGSILGRWNIIKLIIILLSAVICLLQISDIAKLYFKFETVVAVRVRLLETPYVPAVTICFKNILRKSSICKHKGLAGKDCDNFADKYSSNITSMKEMIFDIIASINDTKVIQAMGYSYDEAIEKCEFIPNQHDFPEVIQSCRKSTVWIFANNQTCHAINVKWSRNVGQEFLSENNYKFKLFINLNPSEYIFQEETPLAEIIVHNPGVFPPQAAEIKGLKGYHYEIGNCQSSIEYMQPPYGEPCRFYYEEWLNDDLEFASQTVCLHKCKSAIAMEKCNCVIERTTILENDKICPLSIKQNKCVEEYHKHISVCNKICVRNCRVRMFDPDMERMTLQEFNPKMSPEKLSRSTSAEIGLKRQREVLYIHSPKITPTEIFGYIGGFLGVWLGLSVPQMLTWTENLVRRVQFVRKEDTNSRDHLHNKVKINKRGEPTMIKVASINLNRTEHSHRHSNSEGWSYNSFPVKFKN